MIFCLSDLWPPFPGGAERLMFNIARDLHRRGNEVRALTGYEAAMELDGPPVVSMPIPIGDQRDEWAAIVRSCIEELQPNVILTHHCYAYQFEPELVASGVPVVQVVLNGRRLPGAALAVYISNWVREQLGDAESEDLVLTPPAFAEVVADEHGDAIGFVKPIPHKGVDLVYRIASAMPDRRFVILRGEWQDLEDIRPAPNITFMEPVVDIREFYRECRLVLMPSRSEDAGTVAQEAALNGLPCISSNAGGLVETNAGGIRLDPEPVDPWLRAIRDLDDPWFYEEVARRQLAYLRETNHAATLDELAGRIATLTGARV